MKKIFRFICFFYLLSLTAYSQDYLVKFLDISQGLSNNSVTSIYQDKTGYIWFGSNDGLNRYDGYEFKTFRNKINDTNTISANFVFCIDGDKKGNVWVGTANGGSVIDPQTGNITQLSIDKAKNIIRDENVREIKQFEGNNMLVGCEKSGLIVYENLSLTGTQIPLFINGKGIKKYYVTCIEPVSGKQFCWIFIKNYGLFKYWNSSRKLQFINNEKRQSNILKEDTNGVLWVGTDEGMFPFYENSLSYGKSLLQNKSIVTNILIDSANEMYFTTDGDGIFKVNKQNKVIAFGDNGKQPILKSDAIWGIYEDRDKNKWIGTLRGGISMISNSKRYFNHIKATGNSPAINYILSFCEDSDKKIWIGTDGAGLRLWNRSNNSFEKFVANSEYKSDFVPGIVSDKQHNLWVATWDGGLNKINTITHNVVHYKFYNSYSKQEENNIWVVFKDSKNTIWATTKEGTLFYYNATTDKFEVFNSNLSGIISLTESKDGKLWAGTFSELIQIDKTSRKFKKFKIGYPVRCILEDKKFNLWIGTSEGGFLKFNPKNNKSIRFTTSEGLPSNIVLRLLEDKEGCIWLSTYNGLSRFDPAKGIFRNFTISDGLQSNQFSYNAGLKLSTGEFLFGGINGFNVFSPTSIKEINRNHNILLDDIQVNNNSVINNQEFFKTDKNKTKVLEVEYDQTTISLDFVALDFENADKINYAYYLDGWDDHWNYVGKGRKARYSKLQEGEYEFKVKITNNYMKWEGDETLLIIHVLPPWYRTWWAYILYVMSGIGVLYFYVRYNNDKQRMRYEVKLAHMENLKEKEFSEKQISMFTYISHEFRTPLSLIINPINKLLKQQKKTGDPAPELIVAHRNARRLLSLVDQLLLFRRAENDADQLVLSEFNLNKLCDEVYHCFTEQSKLRKIKYSIEFPSNTIFIVADYEKIEISLFNLVSNAFKYTPEKGEIKIILEEENNEVEIKIIDTGVGIKKDELSHIYEKFRQVNLSNSTGKGFGIGLFIVKYFIEKHLGRIECESEQEIGTKFTLVLKKGSEHFGDLPINILGEKMSELVKELNVDIQFKKDQLETISSDHDDIKEKLNDEIFSEKKSILIIDDNDEIRNYLVQLFNSKYITYAADNGIDGFKMVNKLLPDIVLSDISMGGMSGLELCKKIKENSNSSHILVVLLTATTNSEIHLQGITDGADDYMTKPFDDDILMAKVEALLRNRSQLKNYYLDSITLSANKHKVPLAYRDFLNKCIEVIEQNIGNEKFSTRKFATEMGMSHTKLFTKVKEISGHSLNSFIRSVRIRRAAVLMLTEDILISHAASQVGMEDVKYFREQFVKLYGMTPSDFIKKYRKSFNSELNIIQKP